MEKAYRIVSITLHVQTNSFLLNKTVQFYSPEFANNTVQGENTALFDEIRKQSVRTSLTTC